MFSKIFLSAALLFAVSAHAADGPAADKKDEVVCTTEQSIGSHLPKKTCMTRAQQEERKKADQEKMRNLHTQQKANSSFNK